MSSQSQWKPPWFFRFAQLKFMWGANMNFAEYSNQQLLQSAEYAFWCDDLRFANYIMEEIALRIIEEHPPDGERMEIEIEESSKETGAPSSRGEAYDEYFCFERGSN